MNRWLLKMLVLAITAVVLMVFVSPAVDLEPTAMRAWRAALMLAFLLSSLPQTIIARESCLLLQQPGVESHKTPRLHLPFDSFCPLLC
jgi:hypothetical protein